MFSQSFLICFLAANLAILVSSDNDLAYRNNRFAIALFQSTAIGTKNFVQSPLSVSVVLSMLLDGAKGTTASEINSTLGYDRPTGLTNMDQQYKALIPKLQSSKNYQLSLANSIWVQESTAIVPAYKEQMKRNFLALVDSFQDSSDAVTRVNAWVSTNTKGKIPELLDEVPSSTIMILVNAIYFQGNWVYQFNENNTASGAFEGSTTPVDYMYQNATLLYKYSDKLRSKLLKLPYKGDEIELVIILPEANKDINLSSSNYDALKDDAGGKFSKALVQLKLPKFKIETTIDLNTPLFKLGMKKAFSDQADLSGMVVGGGKVSKVVQKAIIEVNERGTEAAAATAVVITKSLPRYVKFFADHPFLFLIHNFKTNTVLFMGKFENEQ